MTARTMRATLLCGLGLAALAGCEQVGDPMAALSGKTPAPDEFQVVEREALRMPPGFDLPTPRPGAASPLEPDPRRQASAALGMGGEPAAGASGPSRGERALLAAADAAAASDEVRAQLRRDRAEAEETVEYVPPPFWEVLGLGSDDPYADVDPGTLIDPVDESTRLQREGVRTPMDPDAAPREAGEGRRIVGNPSDRPYPESAYDRPRNTFRNTNTTPDLVEEGDG